MACRLFGAKSLAEQMLAYCQLNPSEYYLWNGAQFVLKEIS